MRKFLSGTTFALIATAAIGQSSLPSATIEAYRNGTGAGMAMAAEMNGYPGPRHVLDLGDQMNLTAEQRSTVQAVYERMHAKAVPLGTDILDLERKLDEGFSGGTMTEPELQKLTRTIADKQGQLRFVHLSAHLALKKILTPEQVEAYNRLRGHSHMPM